MLTGIVAFGRTVPEENAAVEGNRSWILAAIGIFAYLQAMSEIR
jgi:hypothetical protein